MQRVIAYSVGGGPCAVINPTSGVTPESQLSKVPAGAVSTIVDLATVANQDPRTWTINADGSVSVNSALSQQAAQLSLAKYAMAKIAGLLSATRTYSAAGGSIKSDATSGTLANLMSLQSWGTANPTSSTNWLANDLTMQQVTGSQIVAIANLVVQYALQIYGVEGADVLTKIASGVIASTSQIDSYPWLT